MNSRQTLLAVIGAILALVVIGSLTFLFGDQLGARVFQQGKSRVAAARGEVATFKLKDSSSVRKLEICTDEKRPLNNWRDFVQCWTIKHTVAAGASSAEGRIPTSFPNDTKAIVITRTRGADGKLLPVAPNDEKIALLITGKASAEQLAAGGDGGGGGGSGDGGGSGGGGGGNSSSSSNDNSQPKAQNHQEAKLSLETKKLINWLPEAEWVDVNLADVNGDDHLDIVGREKTSGDWWAAVRQNDGSYENQKWVNWNPGVSWLDVNIADVNGDGKDDILGRTENNGDWWVALSDGAKFNNEKWGNWSPIDWRDVSVGDFNGDNKDDIAGRAANNGDWWVSLSDGEKFTVSKFGNWSKDVDWSFLQVGDFNADNKDDIASYVPTNGDWWLAVSDGTTFANEKWATWSVDATWLDVSVANVNGDSKDDIVGRDENSGDWWASVSDGAKFNLNKFGNWSKNSDVAWADVNVGDFNGDGKDDVIGRVPANGDWWVGISDGNGFKNQKVGPWSKDATWVDVMVGDLDKDGKTDVVGRHQEIGDWWVSYLKQVAAPMPYPYQTDEPETSTLGLRIVKPQEGSTVNSDQVEVAAIVTSSNNDPISCHNWLLDGRPLEKNDWLNGQSPELSGNFNCINAY